MARPIVRERYTYTASAQLATVEEAKYVNFFGIVVAWETPRKAQRGSDYLCDYVLVDPLITETNVPVMVRIFAPDVRQLPNIRNQGDIIRLHRVKVDKFAGVKLVASLGGIARYGGPLSSYCLFHVNPPPGRDPFIPYQLSSATYHWDDMARLSVESLRNFSIERKWLSALQAGDSSVQKYSRKISTVFTSSADNMTFHDLIILVVAVEKYPDEGMNVVWAWDGTDAPPFPSKFDSRIEEHKDLPPGLSAPAQERTRLSLQRIDSMQYRTLHLNNLIPPTARDSIPRLGSIIPIMLYIDHATIPVPGTWIKLRNCGFHMVHGQLQGYMAAGSRWGPLQPNEGLHEIMHDYWMREKENLVSEFAPMNIVGVEVGNNTSNNGAGPSTAAVHNNNNQLMSSLVVGCGATQQYSALREIMVDWMDNNKTGTCAYRCIARVVNVQPLLHLSSDTMMMMTQTQQQPEEHTVEEELPINNNNTNNNTNTTNTNTNTLPPRGHSSVLTITDNLIQQFCIEAHQLDTTTAQAEGYDIDAHPDEWLYAVRLTLEDGSGTIDVDLFGKQAELFFSSISPPTNFSTDHNARRKMRLAMKLLTRAYPGDDYDVVMRDYRYNDPRGCWLDACIVAYRQGGNNSSGDGSGDGKSSVVLRMFDTKLDMVLP